MNTLSYKTVSINKETAKKEWVVIDATDQVVGRLASKVAKLIRGKYKPSFTPQMQPRLSSPVRRKLTRFTHVTLVIPVVSVSILPLNCARSLSV